ncbi:hypothetical protein F5Y15DRAFT_414535 [Xylariaceae sp. FL0016]|nr:hypothetical protein F5Y15DRAFT_414535 [Xylariaceae sp. FL0016]
MAGIIGSYSDATCNTHNALRNITGYVCGVTFAFTSASDPPPELSRDGYGVPSLRSCCDLAGAELLRIPGNTGCEMQFCAVPDVTTSYTRTVYAAYETGSGTAAATPPPYTTAGSISGPDGRVQNCMMFVYGGDLPDGVADKVADVGSWCVVRMYDDELSEDEVQSAVTAEAAPASWTTTTAMAMATATGDVEAQSGASRGVVLRRVGEEGGAGMGVRIWAAVALLTVGVMVAL